MVCQGGELREDLKRQEAVLRVSVIDRCVGDRNDAVTKASHRAPVSNNEGRTPDWSCTPITSHPQDALVGATVLALKMKKP